MAKNKPNSNMERKKDIEKLNKAQNNNISDNDNVSDELKAPEHDYEAEILVLEKQIEGLRNDYLRSRADFENYRKRKEEELSQARDKAIISFVQSLLPSIDNFEMSLKMTDNKEMFVKGVEMIHKNLLDTLREHKFEDYQPDIGDLFDPYLHEPVPIETTDAEVGKILGVIRKGYKFKESVVRHASVQVAKQIEFKSDDESKKNEENKNN